MWDLRARRKRVEELLAEPEQLDLVAGSVCRSINGAATARCDRESGHGGLHTAELARRRIRWADVDAFDAGSLSA